MYIKYSSLCVNKGKDFIAPSDRERLDQIVRLTSNLHQKQNMAPKIDSRWVNCLSRLPVTLHTSMIL